MTDAQEPLFKDNTVRRVEGGWEGTARYSPGLEPAHRYALTRRWGEPGCELLRWVLCNPSTATEDVLDPTLRKTVKYTKRLGFGGMLIHNIFALRSTDPKALYAHPDPVGPENDAFLLSPGERVSSMVIAGWGTNGAFTGRGAAVREMLVGAGADLRCLLVTKDGHPKHPLYCPDAALFLPYR